MLTFPLLALAVKSLGLPPELLKHALRFQFAL